MVFGLPAFIFSATIRQIGATFVWSVCTSLLDTYSYTSIQVSRGGIVKQLEENNKGDKPEQKTNAPHTLRGSNLKKRKREKPGQIVNATVNNNT